ncbi:MAG: multicopper oxidase domain-containing protein, partial [Spirochaetales bacterium]|nr:multicopper oxidase domain-containing protein [Spirochaetales bacterium]
GFLPEPVETESLVISPGERYEILIDLRGEGNWSLATEVWGGEVHSVLDITRQPEEGPFYEIPETFLVEPVEPSGRPETRLFRLETGMMGRFTINGESMSLERVNFTLKKNSTEVWTITNPDSRRGMMRIPHSFHVHDVQFSLISLNGEEPPPLLRGRKDTILLWPGDEYEIALRFEDYTGIYMYHCHFLEHEDSGMMGQFEVR